MFRLTKLNQVIHVSPTYSQVSIKRASSFNRDLRVQMIEIQVAYDEYFDGENCYFRGWNFEHDACMRFRL